MVDLLGAERIIAISANSSGENINQVHEYGEDPLMFVDIKPSLPEPIVSVRMKIELPDEGDTLNKKDENQGDPEEEPSSKSKNI